MQVSADPLFGEGLQAAVQRERATSAQSQQDRDEALTKCSNLEKEVRLTHSLKQQHWEAVKNVEALRAEVSATPCNSMHERLSQM